MERGGDDPSVVLLRFNDKPVGDNNNISELTSFHKKMESLEEEPVVDRSETLFKQPHLRIPIIVAGATIFTVAVVLATVFLIVKFAVPPPEVSSQRNITTLPPFISTSISSSSSSSVTSPKISPTPSSPPIVSSVSSSLEPSSTSTSSLPSSPSVTPSSELSKTTTVISSSVSITSTISSTSSTRTVTASSAITTPSVTTAKTTLYPACDSGKFQCSDGTCIDNLQVCDGLIQCPEAEDEKEGCKCSSDQFTCTSGQCVSSKHRCDGTMHCIDLSDEVNCENCHGYQCASGLCLWWNAFSRCDGIIQCPDLSDEISCPARWGSISCRNGIQIPANLWCNGIDECFDNSDEQNCSQECSIFEGKKWCADGKTCILVNWFCDGYPDCPDGTDELKCRKCKADQLQCQDYSCVDQSRVCDGVSDCPSGLDEKDCLTLTSSDGLSATSGFVMVKTFESQLPVCSDNWSKEMADEVCFYFGHGASQGSDFFSMAAAGLPDTGHYMGVSDHDPAHNQTVLVRLDKVSTCQSSQVVKLTCTSKACGERKLEYLTPFIVGGTVVAPGKWPWVASIWRLGADICGGVLLNEDWVLTAAHCIVTSTKNYTLVPHYFKVTVGSIYRNISGDKNAERRLVDRIVMHPEATILISGVMKWDMALLHLSESVTFGDHVQPVCLPEQSQSFPVKSACFLAGWGKVNPMDLTVDRLREAKMRLWDDSICRSNMITDETSVDTNSTICAGYTTGTISACQGDSGGPLMCRDVRGRWTVVGVMSSGVTGCDAIANYKANRYAKVSSATEWIESVIEDR